MDINSKFNIKCKQYILAILLDGVVVLPSLSNCCQEVQLFESLRGALFLVLQPAFPFLKEMLEVLEILSADDDFLFWSNNIKVIIELDYFMNLILTLIVVVSIS